MNGGDALDEDGVRADEDLKLENGSGVLIRISRLSIFDSRTNW